MEICSRLDIDDPLVSKWQDVLSNLADYPIDESGYMIARGVPFDRGHRHYSHLLMLYPLYLVNREQDGAEALARRSVEHWHTITPRGTGYTKTGASSIMAGFGLGNPALEKLNEMQPYITPNTMYKEAARRGMAGWLMGVGGLMDVGTLPPACYYGEACWADPKR